MNNENNLLKLEVALDKIFFPKFVNRIPSGEFGIFTAKVLRELENTIYKDKDNRIKLKGPCPLIEYGPTYKVWCRLSDQHPTYGDTYEIIYMSRLVEISDKESQKEFMRTIVSENVVEELFNTYDDVIKILNDKDVEKLCKVKGIKAKTAIRILNTYEDCKDYSTAYIELGQLGLTPNFIRSIVDYFRSPEVAIDKIRNDPYSLVEIDGIGFKKADDIAQRVGIEQFDTRRVKGFMLHHLQEQAEAGFSYLYYQQLMSALYETLGFVPENIISESAKQLMSFDKLYVSPDGMKVALKQYYKLEEQILEELKRLQIGRVEIVENEEETDNSLINEILDEYIPSEYEPMQFNISNTDETIKRVEFEQGFEFTEEQRNAIKISIDNNVIAITGGAGCVDCDTEFFNGKEWKKISEFNENDLVLQYNKDGTAELVKPLKYHKYQCDELFEFKTKYIDQCLSDDHEVYYITSKNNLYHKSFKEVKKDQINGGFHGRFITAFNYSGKGIPLTDNEIRIMVAIFADGSFYYNVEPGNASYYRVRFHLKKKRKKERLIQILNELNYHYRITKSAAKGYNDIYFDAPYRIKHYPEYWYQCNQHQFKIIADEVMYWDGDYKEQNRFFTTDKKDADFIQFVFSSLNYRTSILTHDRRNENVRIVNGKSYERKSIDYCVNYSNKILVGLNHDKRTPENITKFNSIRPKDGYKYCFTVPSHMLILRRNDKIFITGNCGKSSTAKGVCNLYSKANISACALSGKAALRITEATGFPAATIHRTLGYMNGKFTFNKYNKLPCDILLIDEATMINGHLFLSLLEAVPSGAKVIMLGDINQLTPIGNCQVFGDILAANAFPTVGLTKPHRQALRSGIIPTSISVATQQQIFDSTFEGNTIVGELQDMELDITTESKDLLPKVVEKFQEQMKKYNDVLEVQICVPMKSRGTISCYSINNAIQNIYNPLNNFTSESNVITNVLSGKGDDIKKYEIRVNDKVINRKNNYNAVDVDGNNVPVFNGNIGIVKEINDKYAVINFQGIGEIIIDDKNYKNLELAYACTVHSLQGSGFVSTIVALDNSSYIMNNCELLYTAITRAKKYCVLIANNYAVKKSIETKEVRNKQTFLKEMLLNSKKDFEHESNNEINEEKIDEIGE